MPTVKTVKPLGGGDFTTLAAWQSFAATQATADQWAECYSGGNLGAVFLTGWVATPTALVFPQIYAEAGSRHNGQIVGASGTNGAWILSASTPAAIRSQVSYTRIDGLVVNKDTVTGPLLSFVAPAHDYTVTDCVLRRNGGTATALFTDAGTTPTVGGVFQNNVLYLDPAVTATASGTAAAFSDGDGSGGTCYIVGNTLLYNKKLSFGMTLSLFNAQSVVWGNVVYGTDTAGGAFSLVDANDPGHVASYSNNATDDGGSAFYGDGAEQNLTGAITLYLVSGTNPTPCTGSILINTGKNWQVLGLPSVDIIGTSRPQGAAFDIGAFEFIPGGGSGRRRRHTSEVYL